MQAEQIEVHKIESLDEPEIESFNPKEIIWDTEDPTPKEAEKIGTPQVLSQNCVKYLRLGMHLSGWWGSSPYVWEAHDSRAGFSPSPWKRFLWRLHNIVYCSYWIFVFFRWIQYGFYREGLSSPYSIALFYICASYCITYAAQHSIWQFYGEHHLWVNAFLDFMAAIQCTQSHTKVKLTDKYKICKNFMRLFPVVFLLDIWSAASLTEAPWYISSLTSEPQQLTGLERCPLVSFHIYIWIHAWQSMFFYILSQVPYMTGIKNTLSVLKFGTAEGTNELKGKDRNSRQVVRKTKNFAIYYRQTELLHSITNQMWCIANVIFEVSLLLLIICACYGALRLDKERAMQQGAIAIMMTYTLLLVWGFMGEVYEESCDVRDSWKIMLGNRYFRRFYISARPIRIHIGKGWFFVDREIRLTLLDIITNNVATLLLSN